MLNQFRSGTVTGTGATLAVDIGFKPKKFVVKCRDGSGSLTWYDHMTSGSALIDCVRRDGIITPTVASMGTTKDYVANTLFSYQVRGVKYTKAATAAGTGPTATTVPQNTYGLFGFEVIADGTLSARDAADNATGYASAALAIAAKPAATSLLYVFAFYVVVINTAAAFVGNTTLFDATGVTATYYGEPTAMYLSTLGITPVDNGSACGVTIGADTYVNLSGMTLDWEAQY